MKRPGLIPLRPVLRALLNSVALPVLSAQVGLEEGRRVLARAWDLYPAQLAAVDGTAKLGAGPALVMRLSATVIALHKALIEAGTTHGEAVEIAGKVAWAVYRKMSRIPWLLSGIVSRDPEQRLDISTQIFRRFPFGPSAYEWKSRPAPAGVVAFDCLRCPVAEHFAKAGLQDLCVRTFCDLDFPLAADWSATLERTGSIAAGAAVCDFRWQAKQIGQIPPFQPDVPASVTL